MKSQKQTVALIAFLLTFLGASLMAAVPSEINFQARITDSTGNPINDTVDLTIKLYDDPFTPTEKWSEVHPMIPLVDIEIVELKLSSINPFPVDIWDNNELWLGITVNTDPEITPRIRILSVPYALRAEGVDGHIITAPSSIYIPDLTKTDTLISFTPGSVTFEGVPVDFDGTEASWLASSHVRVKIDSNGMELETPGTTLTPAALPAPLVPASDEIYIMIADDVFGQIFASMHTSGQLQTYSGSTNTISQLLPENCSFFTDDGATLKCRVGNTGLELHGGSVQLLDGADLTVTGTLDLSGGTLNLGGSSLTIGGDLEVGGSLTTDNTRIFSDGAGTLTLDGPATSSLTLSESGLVSDLGSVRIDDGGGAVVLSSELLAGDLTLRVNSNDHLRLSSTSGTGGGGRMVLSDGSAGSLQLELNDIKFSDGTTDAGIRRVGDILEVYYPPIATAGLDLGGLVTFSDPSLISIKTGTDVEYEDGSLSRYIALTSDLTVDGSGILARGSTLELQPSGGGAGGRVTLTSDLVTLTDDLSTDVLTLDRTGGVTLVVGASGTTAIYSSSGVQLSGPAARQMRATAVSISLTRPSLNDAYVCDLDDASDLSYYDLDDDGVRDIRCQHTPTKELVLESGTGLRCDGPTSLSSCDVSGPATYASSVDISGTMTCNGPTNLTDCDVSGLSTHRNTWECDADDDGTVDVRCHAGTGAELLVATGTRFACDGLSTFAQPVQVNSDLQVTGALTVLGPKAFVQEHPEDETKQIVYVALEGNEAGTYTRGSSQLVNGVAEIDLPDDFRMVTNAEGLTAQITPRGPVQSMLYVESITPSKLIVKSSNKKDGNVKFDFMINGVRTGFENHQVIQDKKSLALTD